MEELMNQGKVAVVTGAAQGLGTAIAEGLASPETTLVLLDRSPRVKEVADRLSAGCRSAVCHVVDLADGAAITELTRTLTDDYARCDILVNNAALSPKAS